MLLTKNCQTSRKGVYAVGGSISPSYMEIQSDRTIRERKHSNLIYTAIKDAVLAVEDIVESG